MLPPPTQHHSFFRNFHPYSSVLNVFISRQKKKGSERKYFTLTLSPHPLRKDLILRLAEVEFHVFHHVLV